MAEGPLVLAIAFDSFTESIKRVNESNRYTFTKEEVVNIISNTRTKFMKELRESGANKSLNEFIEVN